MLLSLLAYFVIPLYTVLFACNARLFLDNFTIIGNYFDKKLEFVLWGILVGGYFYTALRTIIRTAPFRRKKGYLGLLYTACILLIFAVTTPYLPETVPFQSFLHVVFAFCSAVVLLFLLLLLTYRLAYRRFGFALLAIILVSAYLLLRIGVVSSILEVFLTLTTTVLVRLLLRKVEAAYK